MYREIEIDVAARAMMDLERAARLRHGLSFGDCRLLARIALEAIDKAEDALNPADDARGILAATPDQI